MQGWTDGVAARQLLHPYYALHLLCVLAYFALRFFALPSMSPASLPTFLRWRCRILCVSHILGSPKASLAADICRLGMLGRSVVGYLSETQAGSSFFLVLLIKFVKCDTLEGFIGDVMMYGKLVLAVLVAILDPRMLAWFLFTFIVTFVLWHPPTYTGLGKIILLTPLQLESHLLENRTSAWLVEFGAVWSPQCNLFRRIFADISSKYSTPALQFGRVDVGHFPKIASKYGIEFGVALRQLPTLILFEGGVEVARLPRSSYDGATFAPILTKSMVIRHFELDRMLIRALSRKSGPVRGEALGK